ncbi:chromatin assembly factor 1 subunit A-like [Battus philenor]|uniref:chromatin assembly factor 1 subunit A-like n=1 Tax=Battus philenor TaxID=42288 RepID=UPI0035D0A9CC
MKTHKEEETVTPSKKKLKQARLPFKVLSDDTPTQETTQTRKRKLSTPDAEPITKVGKITNENNTIDDLVVISDEESKDEQKRNSEEKTLNPFVKLVDTAWKKKLLRNKSSKKKKHAKNATEEINKSNSDSTVAIKENSKSLCMDVDSSDDNVNEDENLDKSEEKLNKSLVLEESNASKNGEIKCEEDNDIVSQNENKISEKELRSTEEGNSGNRNQSMSPVTPKRSSSRNKARVEAKNNLNESQSSVDNESSNSNTTPRHNTRSSSISSNHDVSLNNSTTLTPKRQSQKRTDSEKKKEERERERQEKEKKKQLEKEEKAKQRLEKEEQRKREREEKEELKRKEKEEKEDQKRKEREEKERQKELEKKLKEEKEKLKKKEREEKEEMRRKEKEAKEEEKRKKQEALELEKLEQEQKKKKAAEAFVNFFVPKQKNEKDQHTIGPVSKNSMLSSFTIKADMRLAPTTRNYITDEQKQALESFLEKQDSTDPALYIQSLKLGIKKPMSTGKTWPLNDKDDDVIIVEDDLPPIDDAGEILSCEPVNREKLRPKLLSFHENRRPPYWGTWRKRSEFVKPRRPFQQDEKQLDYEVDSDEEWEEEQEGESIDGSAAGSDDEQDGDEYEVDNEVFVPHGYLSDEEATVDEDDVLSLSPETQKARLKHLEDEFEHELKKPTEKLKPRMYGLLWETPDGEKPEKCVDTLWNYFRKLSMIMNDPTPLLQPSPELEETEKKKLKKKKSSPDVNRSPLSADKKKKSKSEIKESKKMRTEARKSLQDPKKMQPGINTFLTKLKSP